MIEECMAVEGAEDWRQPYLDFLVQKILPTDSKQAYAIKRSAMRYFVDGGILFIKGFCVSRYDVFPASKL